jgi:hypothetical protein
LGDKLEGWDDEQGNLKALLASQNKLEIAATCNLDDPVKEIQEFEYLVENIEVEEGKADNNNEEEVFDFDLVTVKIKTYTAPELKDVCRALSLVGVFHLGDWSGQCQRIQNVQIDVRGREEGTTQTQKKPVEGGGCGRSGHTLSSWSNWCTTLFFLVGQLPTCRL